MGATSFYALPYPGSGDTVNIPRDIQALADKLELWKNGLTIPAGGLALGQSGAGTAYDVKLYGPIGGSQMVASNALSAAGPGGATWVITKDGNEVNRLVLAQDGTLQMLVGGQYRPVPFATQMGNVTLPTSATNGTSNTVTFLAGRFTQVPWAVVQATSGAGSNAAIYAPRVTSIAMTGMTVACASSAATFASALPINWIAQQMTPGTTPGLLAPMAAAEDHPSKVVTCHHDGCPNAGIPITLPVPAESMGVTCGPCAQSITDITEASDG